jgi:cyclohexyl-isocyanide hydratase
MISVGFLVFPGLQLLDLAGPYEVFAALPDSVIHLVWKSLEPINCSTGLSLTPTATLQGEPALTVLCIPGGPGINALLLDEEVLAWVRRQAAQAQFVTSVCTGALLLGAAGLLDGRRATTHWRYLELLTHFGAIPVHERVVHDGNLITGGGVTAGIDFGLAVAANLRGRQAAEEIQLALEYAPAPPYNAGRPDAAPETTFTAVCQRTQALYDEREDLVQRCQRRQWPNGRE